MKTWINSPGVRIWHLGRNMEALMSLIVSISPSSCRKNILISTERERLNKVIYIEQWRNIIRFTVVDLNNGH